MSIFPLDVCWFSSSNEMSFFSQYWLSFESSIWVIFVRELVPFFEFRVLQGLNLAIIWLKGNEGAAWSGQFVIVSFIFDHGCQLLIKFGHFFPFASSDSSASFLKKVDDLMIFVGKLNIFYFNFVSSFLSSSHFLFFMSMSRLTFFSLVPQPVLKRFSKTFSNFFRKIFL
jgi:hypothetical protein